VLYVGQVEERKVFTYKVKFMRRLGETWKFAFPDTILRERNRKGRQCDKTSMTNVGLQALQHWSIFVLISVSLRETFCSWSKRVLFKTLSSCTFIYF
jgi:hypothetical protein